MEWWLWLTISFVLVVVFQVTVCTACHYSAKRSRALDADAAAAPYFPAGVRNDETGSVPFGSVKLDAAQQQPPKIPLQDASTRSVSL